MELFNIGSSESKSILKEKSNLYLLFILNPVINATYAKLNTTTDYFIPPSVLQTLFMASLASLGMLKLSFPQQLGLDARTV